MADTWLSRRRSSRQLRLQRLRRAVQRVLVSRDRLLGRSDPRDLAVRSCQRGPPGRAHLSVRRAQGGRHRPSAQGVLPVRDRLSGWRSSGSCRAGIAFGPDGALDAGKTGGPHRALRTRGALWANRTDRAGTSGAGGQANRQDGKDSAQDVLRDMDASSPGKG